MDGHASNANNAESYGEASASAGGNPDGRFAQPGEFILEEDDDHSRAGRDMVKIGENCATIKNSQGAKETSQAEFQGKSSHTKKVAGRKIVRVPALKRCVADPAGKTSPTQEKELARAK